jgi:hypothetical protein
MTNEPQKSAPGTTKVDPANKQPPQQQNQGDGKPGSEKPANQQK